MNFKNILFILVLTCFALFPFCGDVLGVHAQEAGAEAAPAEAASVSLLDTIKSGGTIGHIIILMSIITGSLSLMYFMSLRRDKLVPPDILGELEVLFEDEDYEGAMELCESEPCFLTNVVVAALPKIALGFDVMVDTMRAVQDEEATKLQIKISALSLIGAMAPMMGLLGTVTGMIGAFNKIATAPTAPKPKELAEGIGQALVTTAEGLIVAIPAIIAYFILRNIVTKATLEVAAISEELVERFRPVSE